MILDKYLDRINFTGKISPVFSTLKKLHKAQVLSIPFEDLDIHFNHPIRLDLKSLYDKVILNNRGGFCYELNFLFYHLLREIGFQCKMVSSRIFNEQESIGPEFDHMSIIVTLNKKWLVDVGYGDLFIEPIELVDGHSKKDWFKFYQINQTGEFTYLLSESKNGKDFKKRYIIDERPRRIEDFFAQCEIKQHSKESYFVKNKLCTIPTLDGRLTLLNDKFTERKGEIKNEVQIQSDEHFLETLKEKFGIEV